MQFLVCGFWILSFIWFIFIALFPPTPLLYILALNPLSGGKLQHFVYFYGDRIDLGGASVPKSSLFVEKKPYYHEHELG